MRISWELLSEWMVKCEALATLPSQPMIGIWMKYQTSNDLSLPHLCEGGKILSLVWLMQVDTSFGSDILLRNNSFTEKTERRCFSCLLFFAISVRYTLQAVKPCSSFFQDPPPHKVSQLKNRVVTLILCNGAPQIEFIWLLHHLVNGSVILLDSEQRVEFYLSKLCIWDRNTHI